jgi:arylsulfatase A-like enzyme
VRELRAQGVLDQTMIIVMADNGRPFPHSKTQLYDDSLKPPLVIRWPAGIPRPARVVSLVSSIDIAPTVLELAGLPRPETFQGVSLVPLLRDPQATVRDFVFAEHNWHNFPAHVRMVRTGNYVYLRNAWPDLMLPGAADTFYNPSADALKAARARGTLTPLQANVFLQPRPSEEFFDLAADPLQETNLAGSPNPPPALAKLRAAMTRWTEETGDTVQTRPSPADTILECRPEDRRIRPRRTAGRLRSCAPHQPAGPRFRPLKSLALRPRKNLLWSTVRASLAAPHRS